MNAAAARKRKALVRVEWIAKTSRSRLIEAMKEEPEMNEERNQTPGDQLRSLPTEAQERGTRFVSAQAMQARLFSVYDAAAAAEDALALVQQQLTLTLNRSYYEADEIESMADQLDSLLALESLGLTDEDLVPGSELVSEE
jgi:hypothetical protein